MNTYHFYVITTPHFKQHNLYKLGITRNLNHRLQVYMTGCPPIEEYEMVYILQSQPISLTHEQACKFDAKFKAHFSQYQISNRRKTEWHKIIPTTLQEQFDKFQECFPTPILENFTHDPKLDALQAPIIQNIQSFLASSDIRAGVILAACGTGKTMMMTKALLHHKMNQCIIVVPTTLLCNQWKDCLKDIFSHSEFRKPCSDRYCYILTNAASKDLIHNITAENIDLIIFDEGHHMAGVLSKNTGQGITRGFLHHIKNLNIKRIFLTATLRYTDGDCTISMDDEAYFGKIIARVDYGEVVRQEILPRPIMHIITNDNCEVELSKHLYRAHTLVNAWIKPDFYQGCTLHHLIIFTQSHVIAEEIYEYIQSIVPSSIKVIRLTKDDKSHTFKIKEFESAQRAILINCKVLAEGISIPCLDSVAILHNIRSKEFATQMLLRPNRKYVGKKNFHILLPNLEEETNNFITSLMEQLLQGAISIRRIKTYIRCDKFEEYDIDEPEIQSNSDIITITDFVYSSVIQIPDPYLNITHPTIESAKYAIINNNIELLKYLMRDHITVSDLQTIDPITICITHQHITILKYLIETLQFKPENANIELATDIGSLEIVQYLVTHGIEITNKCVNLAIKHKCILHYFIKIKVKPNIELANIGIQCGDLQLLEYTCASGIMPSDTLYTMDIRRDVMLCILKFAVRDMKCDIISRLFNIGLKLTNEEINMYATTNMDIAKQLIDTVKLCESTLQYFMACNNETVLKLIVHNYSCGYGDYDLHYDVLKGLLDMGYVNITQIALWATHCLVVHGAILSQYLKCISICIKSKIIPYNYWEEYICEKFIIYERDYTNAELCKYIKQYGSVCMNAVTKFDYKKHLVDIIRRMREVRRLVDAYDN